MASVKKRVYEIVEGAQPGDRASEIFDIFIISLICLNVVALIVETVEEVHQVSPQAFRIFEIISVVIFTVEYLLRVWSCTTDEEYGHPVWGRLRFAVSPVAFIGLSGDPAVLHSALRLFESAGLAILTCSASLSPDRPTESLFLWYTYIGQSDTRQECRIAHRNRVIVDNAVDGVVVDVLCRK